MKPDVLCPAPVRPYERHTLNIEPECVHPSNYHRLQSPTLPPTNDHSSGVPRSTSAPPGPRSAQRAVEEFDHIRTPTSKSRQLFSSTDSPLEAWLTEASRPSSPPNNPQSNRPASCAAAIDISMYTPAPLRTIKEMFPQQHPGIVGPGSGASQSSRPSISHRLYRGMLYCNFVIMDCSGRKMPQKLRIYVNTHILKRRKSCRLGDKMVSKVIETAEKLADSTEGPTTKLMSTAMFPLERSGIAEGGNSPWNPAGLPNDPKYEYSLSAPKPDAFFGYPKNEESGWSHAQINVIDHPRARLYSQPARGPTFPFLAVEIKSEPAGGTLYVAENQAAGSGSYAVNALLWLLNEACPFDSPAVEDTIAFTISMCHRHAIFYIHWYSADDGLFYMSYLKSYSTMEPMDIRACNNTVKNILDHALGPRKTKIDNALRKLFPFPEHWKQSRPASTDSFIGDARPRKDQRRSFE